MKSSNSIDGYRNLDNSSMQDDQKLASLFSMLRDRISLGIVRSTMEEAKSAFEISRENSIPASSVYKKLRKLKDDNIVQLETIVTEPESGKRTAYYRCNIELLKITLDRRDFRVWLRTNEERSGKKAN